MSTSTTPPPPDPAPGKRRPGRPRKAPVPDPVPEPIAAPALDARELALLAEVLAPTPAPVPPGLSTRQRLHARELLAEAERRRCESLRLYTPLPSQAAFHASMARQRLIWGSNRGGKTTPSMVELAWAATGSHPIAGKYPARDGRAIVVAKDEEKIGEVIWRKLGRAGAFRIGRDPATGTWRPFLPARDVPLGVAPKLAPPLIPPRLIADVAWVSKKSGIPSKVILTNGWEVNFYSSKSDPFTIQGTDIDIAVFDEEIVHHAWFPEANARLIDRMGRFWWGATPHQGTAQLLDLHLRAEEAAEAEDPEPLVQEFFASIWDNPYLEEKAKRDYAESIDEEERAVRIDGKFAVLGTMIYEGYFFPRGVHRVEPFPVPPTWTRFVSIDPGAQVCAVLFAAVPPLKIDKAGLDLGLDPSLYGDFVYAISELYLKRCDANLLAARLTEAVGDQEIHAFLIDHHGGRATEIGSGKTPEQQYREAFKKARLGHFVRGGSFTYGSDDLAGGILRVKEFLRVRDDGTAKLRVLDGRCPMLVRQLGRYRWKVVQGQVTDKPVKADDHQCDNLRYVCMHPGLKWHRPKDRKKTPGTAYEAFKAFKGRQERRRRAREGPGITLG